MGPVTNKTQMYRLLAAGAFGNTISQYFSVAEWAASPDAARYDWWGVRTLTPGGPCRLNCPRGEVAATATRPEYAAAGVNISIMVDQICTVTLWGEVYDSPAGLLVYGIEYPPRGSSWRLEMPSKGRHWEGVAARMLLRKHLSPDSLDDLEILRDTYPGHIYEFSAFDRHVGTVPGRNAVCWELRAY